MTGIPKWLAATICLLAQAVLAVSPPAWGLCLGCPVQSHAQTEADSCCRSEQRCCCEPGPGEISLEAPGSCCTLVAVPTQEDRPDPRPEHFDHARWCCGLALLAVVAPITLDAEAAPVLRPPEYPPAPPDVLSSTSRLLI